MLLATVPEFEVVGSYSHVLDCLEDIGESNPGIILMDIEMPGMSCIEAVKKSSLTTRKSRYCLFKLRNLYSFPGLLFLL